MKKSHQILMLAILMGLLAWVVDAGISWYFFPGKTFLEILWQYDPLRTLYVRSSVVMLFFCFGLWAGYLMDRLESQKAADKQNIFLLKGIRDIQDCIFHAESPETMIRQVCGLMKESFHFERVSVVRVDSETLAPLFRYSTVGETEEGEKELRFLEDLLLKSNGNLTASRLTHDDGRPESRVLDGKTHAVLSPLFFNGVVHGVVLGTWKENFIYESTHLWEDQFYSACNQIGKSVAHIQEVRESEANAVMIQRLFDLSPMGVFITSLSGKAIYFNPAMHAMLTDASETEHDLYQKPVTEWYQDPQDREQLVTLLHKNEIVTDFEFTLTTSEGKLRTVILAGRLNREVNPEDPHIEGFILDITNRKSSEETNRKLHQELEKNQHYKAIAVLAGGIAHEFNNILQTMMGSAYLATLKLEPGQSEVTGYLENIQTSGKRAAKLCDQILSYAGKRTMMLKLEDADECVERILLMLQKELNQGITLQRSLQAGGVKAHLDFTSLSEVVNNLVLNSEESMGNRTDGQINISTSLRSREDLERDSFAFHRQLQEEEYWVLSVSDNGSGIAQEHLPRIFEPFYTTKFQGRGLGLSATVGIVEKFDASLGIRTEVGEGTEVLLCLPVAESVVVVSDEEEEDASLPQPGKQQALGKVWVVDDEPLIGQTVMLILKKQGYEVEIDQSSRNFLSRFNKQESEQTSCLLLDLTMPDISGLEVLKKVREFAPHLPVVIMSGYDDVDNREEYSKLQVAGYIHKPFRMNDLVDKMNSVLNARDG